MKKIKILIADDHKLVREAWASFLNNDPRMEVIATTGDSEEAVELARIRKPDIIIMDISMAPFSGIEATRKILHVSPRSNVIGISFYTQPAYARKMLQEGAKGYVTKNSPKEEMLEAIIELHNGNKFICAEIKNIISNTLLGSGNTDEPGIDLLTEREMEIIHKVRDGLSSKEIAASLNISLKTVEVHRHNILKKLKLKNSAALVNFINTKTMFS
jgi:DNA-binding NarL/FixJ family response regulator